MAKNKRHFSLYTGARQTKVDKPTAELPRADINRERLGNLRKWQAVSTGVSSGSAIQNIYSTKWLD